MKLIEPFSSYGLFYGIISEWREMMDRKSNSPFVDMKVRYPIERRVDEQFIDQIAEVMIENETSY